MFGFGLDQAGERLALPSLPLPALRAETAALVARMSPRPDPSRARAIDRLVAALVDGGVWDKLDVLLVLAAHSAQAALLNWKGAADATVGGGEPLFIADRGFWCDGLDDWIDTGFAPAAGVRFQQNSAMMGAWFRKGDRNAASPVGTVSGNMTTLNPRSGSDASAGRLNGSGVANGGTVASGYGFTAVDRPGATTVRQYAGGVPLGSPASASSATRSTATIGLGRANGLFADGQFCAFAAGASLSAAEHALLFEALDGYMAAAGVAALPAPTTRTLAMGTAYPLPDGSAPLAAGRGMAVTGLVRRTDGRWYVGNGSTSRRALLFSRLSADFGTLEAEFTTASLGLPAEMNGSCQGMTLDASDGSVWMLIKLSGAGGNQVHLLRFDPATEQVIGAPIPVAAADTGVAYDAARDRLWITRDTGQLVLYDKTGVPVSGPYPTPAGTDQCFSVAAGGGAFLPGDLLVTAGANGAAGTVCVYNRLDYGGMALRRVDTLTGADAIEGVVLRQGDYFVGNDAHTHPGDPPLNRVLRFPA